MKPYASTENPVVNGTASSRKGPLKGRKPVGDNNVRVRRALYVGRAKQYLGEETILSYSVELVLHRPVPWSTVVRPLIMVCGEE